MDMQKQLELIGNINSGLKDNNMFNDAHQKMEISQNFVESEKSQETDKSLDEKPHKEEEEEKKNNDDWMLLGQSIMNVNADNQLVDVPNKPDNKDTLDTQGGKKVIMASQIKDPMMKSEFLLNKLDDDNLAESDKEESDLEIEFEPSSPAINLNEEKEKKEKKVEDKKVVQPVESLILDDEDFDADFPASLNVPEEEEYGLSHPMAKVKSVDQP